MTSHIVQGIFLSRELLEGGSHWLSELLGKGLASVISPFAKGAKCLFFQVAKAFGVPYLGCFT